MTVGPVAPFFTRVGLPFAATLPVPKLGQGRQAEQPETGPAGKRADAERQRKEGHTCPHIFGSARQKWGRPGTPSNLPPARSASARCSPRSLRR